MKQDASTDCALDESPKLSAIDLVIYLNIQAIPEKTPEELLQSIRIDHPELASILMNLGTNYYETDEKWSLEADLDVDAWSEKIALMNKGLKYDELKGEFEKSQEAIKQKDSRINKLESDMVLFRMEAELNANAVGELESNCDKLKREMGGLKNTIKAFEVDNKNLREKIEKKEQEYLNNLITSPTDLLADNKLKIEQCLDALENNNKLMEENKLLVESNSENAQEIETLKQALSSSYVKYGTSASMRLVKTIAKSLMLSHAESEAELASSEHKCKVLRSQLSTGGKIDVKKCLEHGVGCECKLSPEKVDRLKGVLINEEIVLNAENSQGLTEEILKNFVNSWNSKHELKLPKKVVVLNSQNVKDVKEYGLYQEAANLFKAKE